MTLLAPRSRVGGDPLPLPGAFADTAAVARCKGISV